MRHRMWVRAGSSAIFALALACGEVATTPAEPDFELTDPTQRWNPANVNSHIYGSFRIDLPGVSTVIISGPANFPGHSPKGPGTCENGAWRTADGKLKAGGITKPHPHCISPPSAIEIVLEPVSSCFSDFEGITCARAVHHPAGGHSSGLFISDAGDGTEVLGTTVGPVHKHTTSGFGMVTAYAIDAGTLGTSNRRVGTLTFDLAQYNSTQINYFDLTGTDGCTVDATILAPCLNLIIQAAYAPLASPDGVGTAQTVPGFLWISPATAPYNYIP